ncbi:MAG: phosphoribosylaminoimidazolesuccinocarboxamide synthase [Betaproteobacteria bacterium]|nr:phosphoribosylaminoimidazolesuccinocarboxamide synthase [Betaproteobacteria bacterium]
MSVSDSVVLTSNLKSLPKVGSGKVRDIYAIGEDKLLLVQTDRISAFDRVFAQGIPGKGKALTAMSIAWFAILKDVCRNHLLADDPTQAVAEDERATIAGRSMVVRRLKPLPAEAIARGYLAGSGWQSYQQCQQVCGLDLPAGLQLADRLPKPLFTPSSKAEAGEHDENITFAQLVETIGAKAADLMQEKTLELYNRGHEHAAGLGMILADTKFEFALDDSGELVLIDEVLTPDSSRYWPQDGWQPGHNPPSFDKQFVRDWLTDSGWDRKSEQMPELPADIIEQTAKRYATIAEKFA